MADLCLNPIVLTVIIWGSIFYIVSYVGDDIEVGISTTVIIAIISAVVTSVLFWLFFQFELRLLISIQFWLLAGSLTLGIIVTVVTYFDITDGGGIELYVDNSLGRIGTIIALAAAILGIVAFVIDYMIPYLAQ